jgi:3-oxoadipate enol-lactonase
MPHHSVPGTSLYYQIDGPPGAAAVLLSHSLGNNLTMWDEQVAVLARRYRVLRYDVRGHGQSDAPRGPYALDDLGRDAVALLDALQIERAHFCGLSLGGMTGMWLGVHAPGRLSTLVLANTSASFGSPAMWDDRIRLVRSQGLAAVGELVMGRWFTPAFLLASPEAAERCRQMLLTTDQEGYVSCCAAIRDMDQVHAIGRITTPTLVIVGDQDPSTPPAHGELIASRIAGAKVMHLPAAHLSNVEAAPAFNDALLEFVRNHE